jgi:hypothetical protein
MIFLKKRCQKFKKKIQKKKFKSKSKFEFVIAN